MNFTNTNPIEKQMIKKLIMTLIAFSLVLNSALLAKVEPKDAPPEFPDRLLIHRDASPSNANPKLVMTQVKESQKKGEKLARIRIPSFVYEENILLIEQNKIQRIGSLKLLLGKIEGDEDSSVVINVFGNGGVESLLVYRPGIENFRLIYKDGELESMSRIEIIDLPCGTSNHRD